MTGFLCPSISLTRGLFRAGLYSILFWDCIGCALHGYLRAGMCWQAGNCLTMCAFLVFWSLLWPSCADYCNTSSIAIIPIRIPQRYPLVSLQFDAEKTRLSKRNKQRDIRSQAVYPRVFMTLVLSNRLGRCGVFQASWQSFVSC